jgi:hypothetical protein
MRSKARGRVLLTATLIAAAALLATTGASAWKAALLEIRLFTIGGAWWL